MKHNDNIYELLYKNKTCLIFDSNFKIIDFDEEVKLPFGMKNAPNNIKEWITARLDVGERPNYNKLLQLYNLKNPSIWDIIEVSYCVSFRDCYWVKEISDYDINWENINPYSTYNNEVLLTMLGDEEALVFALGKSCGEFTYRGTSPKGYYRDTKEDKLYVYKGYSDTRSTYRELILSKLAKIIDLRSFNYERTAIRFSDYVEREVLKLSPSTSEKLGFITLEEFLESKFMSYRLNTNVEIYEEMPKNFKETYVKLRMLLYLFDAEEDLEDRICFYVDNDTQEVVEYFGVYGTSRCLLYNMEVEDYSNCRNDENMSEIQRRKLADIRDLLQLIDCETNTRFVKEFEELKNFININNYSNLMSDLVNDTESIGIGKFITAGIDRLLDILRNISEKTRGKVVVVNNRKVVCFEKDEEEESSVESRYHDGYLKISEDSNFE